MSGLALGNHQAIGSHTFPAMNARSIRIGVLSGPGSIDPREAGDTITGLLLEQVFETPFTVLPSGQAEPVLFAEHLRLDVSGSRPVYSAAIRTGIVFSDGTPLTAELAAASLSRTKALLGRATVTARDGRVIFTMSGPSPRFENVLTQWNTAIVLDHGGSLLGTGPYVFPEKSTIQAMRDAGVVRLERNARYRERMDIEELQFVIYPAEADGTPLKLIEAAKRGNIDITLHLSATEMMKFGISGFLPMQQPSNSTSILYFNSERIRDLALRRALQHAINQTTIAEINYERNPLAFVAGDIIPPMMSHTSAPLSKRDRELLRHYTNKPSRLTLVVPWAPRPYIPRPLPTAQEIARQLGMCGIDVDLIVTRSSEDFFSTLARGDYDMALAGWVADNPDPAEFYESLLSSAQISTRSQYRSNLARWNTPAMDAALAAYRADPSAANRKAINDIIDGEAILVPLVYGASTAIRNRRVRNVNITPAGHLAFKDVNCGG